MHCIVLLVRILDQLDFLIYNFSMIYYAILKFQLIFFKRDIIKGGLYFDLRKIWGGFRKNCWEGLWSVGWFFIKRRPFLQKNPAPILSGLRVDFKIIWGVFWKIYWEGPWSAGWFPKNRRGFSKNDRGSSDLGRPRARSNGREKPVTWHTG